MHRRICEILESGESLEGACRTVGISRTTAYRWRVRAKQGEEPFRSFVEAAETATGVFIRGWLHDVAPFLERDGDIIDRLSDPDSSFVKKLE